MKLKKFLSFLMVMLITVSMLNITVRAEEIVPVAGISITPETADLQVGGTIKLTANIEPANATDKNVNWITFDTGIVSVDKTTGEVTGKAPGNAGIAAVSEDGNFIANCTVTVKAAPVSVTGITLNPTSKTLKVGESFTISAAILPDNATNKNIEWKSYDETIAKVDSTGKVTAEKSGTTKIYAVSDDNMKLASCDVTVEDIVPITGISITPETSDLEVGSSLQLTAKKVPTGEICSDVSWVTFDTDIVSVDRSTGKITALKPGTAHIAAVSNNDNFVANCTVNVEAANIPATGISVDPSKTDLTVGKEIQLTATITPSNATNKNVTWVTFDTDIVSVDRSTGTVKGLSKGTANVAAVSEDGSFIAECIINVVPDSNSQDADKVAADAVIVNINSIPDNLTLNDKSKVTDARSAYNSLNDAAKALVTNLSKLENAESVISKLESENNKSVPEKIQNNSDAVKTIVDAINKGSNIPVVDITDNPVVSRDIFNAVKGHDETITFTGNNITWTFNGKDISSNVTGDIDLSLMAVSNDLKTKEIEKIKESTGNNISIVAFSFKYDGELPGNATVKIYISKDWAGKTINIYRYYEDKNSYEEVQSGLKIDADGYVTYTVNHCSDYFAADASSFTNTNSQNTNPAQLNNNSAPVKANTNTTQQNNVQSNAASASAGTNANNSSLNKLPKTGSSINFTEVAAFGIIIIILGSAVVYAGSKRKQHK